MPPLYLLSAQRYELESACLSPIPTAGELLTLSQNLDQMIIRAQRIRKASFRRLRLCARRPRQPRASLMTPFL